MIDLHAVEPVVDMLSMIFLIMLTPLLFILIDLGAGVHKAKVRNEPISSKRLRATIRKIARYYNVLFVLMALDLMQLACLWYMQKIGAWDLLMFPWLTSLGAIGIGLIEVKSVLEPADEKESRQMRDLISLIKAVTEHKTEPTEIADAVITYLNEHSNENDKKSPRTDEKV